MANLGIDPVDPTTLVGTVRLNVGDTASVPLAPAVAGQVSYGYFSDAEITSFLLMANQNPILATGLAYANLSAQVARTAADIQSLDFKVSTSKRAADLLAIAEVWIALANNVEFFSVVDTGVQKLDLRDYLYPTGTVSISDIFWTGTTNDDGATWSAPIANDLLGFGI